MATELMELFERVEDDGDIAMLAITGAGEIFCGGFDADVNPNLVESLAVISKPTVAIVNGDATDEGMELAMAADLRIALAEARFALTQPSRGEMPRFGGTQRLPRLAGVANAIRMLVGGATIDGNEAMRIGLVTYLAGDQQKPRRAIGRSRAGDPDARAGGSPNGERCGPEGIRYDAWTRASGLKRICMPCYKPPPTVRKGCGHFWTSASRFSAARD